jgi:hypothetical protein
VAALLDTVDSDDESASSAEASDDSDGADDDEDALRYEGMVEDYLDRSYQAYLERHHARDANQVQKAKRKRLAADGAQFSSESRARACLLRCVRMLAPCAHARALCAIASFKCGDSCPVSRSCMCRT